MVPPPRTVHPPRGATRWPRAVRPSWISSPCRPSPSPGGAVTRRYTPGGSPPSPRRSGAVVPDGAIPRRARCPGAWRKGDAPGPGSPPSPNPRAAIWRGHPARVAGGPGGECGRGACAVSARAVGQRERRPRTRDPLAGHRDTRATGCRGSGTGEAAIPRGASSAEERGAAQRNWSTRIRTRRKRSRARAALPGMLAGGGASRRRMTPEAICPPGERCRGKEPPEEDTPGEDTWGGAITRRRWPAWKDRGPRLAGGSDAPLGGPRRNRDGAGSGRCAENDLEGRRRADAEGMPGGRPGG